MLDPRAFLINSKTGRVIATTFVEFLSGNSTTPSICFADSPDSGLQCDSNGVVNYIKNGVNQGEIATGLGPDTLGNLEDVDLTTTPPTDGEALVYDSATGDWVPGAAGGIPGGSSGQIQWNSSGSFAGVGGSTVGATGDITLSLNGAADTPPLKLTGTWFTGGTSTTTKPQFLIEPAGTTSTAWSTSGTGLGVNAPSGFAGRLLDLQVNGSSLFRFNTDGTLNIENNGRVETRLTASNGFRLAYNGSSFGSHSPIFIGPSTPVLNYTLGAGLYSDAENYTLAQRNGTNAQTYRLYNTYTDASNYERAYLRWASNVLEIGTEGAGTGSEQPVRITAATLKLPNLPTYADNAAAITGGLVAGDVYKTATGELRITV